MSALERVENLPDQFISNFITANHILSYHGLVDAFGHVSVRVSVPGSGSDVFLLTGSAAPGMMRDKRDIAFFSVDTGEFIAGDRESYKSHYSEHFIHARMYRMFPRVNSVVHSHSKTVVARANSPLPLRPMWHMAGFLGNKVPIFDPRSLYHEEACHDLLVKNADLGDALACRFVHDISIASVEDLHPDVTVLLQRGHGFVTWGSSLQQAVYRAVYTQENAEIQLQAESLSLKPDLSDIVYLNEREIQDCKAVDDVCCFKSWAFWEGLVQADARYVNNIQQKC